MYKEGYGITFKAENGKDIEPPKLTLTDSEGQSYEVHTPKSEEPDPKMGRREFIKKLGIFTAGSFALAKSGEVLAQSGRSPEKNNDQDFETKRKSKPIVYAGYQKNGQRVEYNMQISDTERLMKRDVEELLSYIKGAEAMMSDKKAVAVTTNIVDAQRPPNFSQEIDYDNGTLEEVLEKKNPKVTNIVRIILGGIGSVGGKAAKIGGVVDQILSRKVGLEKVSQVSTQDFFFKVSSKVFTGDVDGQGNGKFVRSEDGSYTFNYAIKKIVENIQYRDPYSNASKYDEVVTYKLYARPLMSGTVATDKETFSLHANFPDDGKMGDVVANKGYTIFDPENTVADDPERLHQIASLMAVNGAILEMYPNKTPTATFKAQEISEQQRLQQLMIQKQNKKNK